MKLFSFITSALIFLFSLEGIANTADFKKSLSKQVEILQQIRPSVERLDQARLLVIRNSLLTISQDMKDNVKAGRQEITFQTLRLIQNLIIQYRFSHSFFGWSEPISLTSIYTPATSSYLLKLRELAQQTETNFGLDDSPYTQITANTFRQMQRLLQQMESLAIDPTLKSQLRSLWPLIGETIAIAEQGDRPKAFAKAVKVIQQIRTFYPRFDQISSTAVGFANMLELQGLAEFYSEFAQIED